MCLCSIRDVEESSLKVNLRVSKMSPCSRQIHSGDKVVIASSKGSLESG